MTDLAASNGHGLELVPARPLVEEGIDIRFALAPGDRVIVEDGAPVAIGTPLAERFREDWVVLNPPVEPGPVEGNTT